jgi:hypothetical protein
MKNILSIIALFIACAAKAQVPSLNSNTDASSVIYIDFDGEIVNSALWNNGNTIVCESPGLSTEKMTAIFTRVAEDFSIFKVNVTTELAKFNAAPTTQRIRVIVTPTSYFFPGVAGVSYVTSFTWGDDTPAFAFAGNANTDKYIAETVSHEAGHAFGCWHQSVYDASCNQVAAYNGGTGDGEIGWAPIMGYPLDKNFTTWHNGKSSLNCNTVQDDVEKIASAIAGGGLKSDDVGNTIGTANLIAVSSFNFTANGILNSSGDVDMFRLNLTEQSRLRLSALPRTLPTGSIGNVDIAVDLLNSTGALIRRYNISDSLKARIDTTISSGTYYFRIDGIANVNMTNDYGSIGDYRLQGEVMPTLLLPIYNIKIAAKVVDAKHEISWDIDADERLRNAELQYSTDGLNFQKLANLMQKRGTYTYMPFVAGTLYYRVGAWLPNGDFKYSTVSALRANNSKPTFELVGNAITENTLTVNSSEALPYSIINVSGKTISTGKLAKGVNQIPINSAAGVYFIKANSSNEQLVQKFVKL